MKLQDLFNTNMKPIPKFDSTMLNGSKTSSVPGEGDSRKINLQVLLAHTDS